MSTGTFYEVEDLGERAAAVARATATGDDRALDFARNAFLHTLLAAHRSGVEITRLSQVLTSDRASVERLLVQATALQ